MDPTISLHKIYSEDALELDAVLFEPVKKTDTVIIHVHGKEGHFLQNHFIAAMGQAYPQAGYAFLTFNNRGHDYMADMLQKTAGGFAWVKKGTAFDKIEEFPRDINGVIAYLHERGYKRIILQGHSLGPHKIDYYLTHQPKYKVDGLIYLSPADTHYLLETYVPKWREHAAEAQSQVDRGDGQKLMSITLWNDAPVSAETFLTYTRSGSDLWIFNYSGDENFADLPELPTLAIFPEHEFSIGIEPHAALTLLGKQFKNPELYSSEVISGTVHNYMGKEKELVGRIVEWLAALI